MSATDSAAEAAAAGTTTTTTPLPLPLPPALNRRGRPAVLSEADLPDMLVAMGVATGEGTPHGK